MLSISSLRYATETVESPVPFVVTNFPGPSLSCIESLSTVSGIVAVLVYQALKWSKDSWEKERRRPQLKAELQLLQRAVPSNREVKVDAGCCTSMLLLMELQQRR